MFSGRDSEQSCEASLRQRETLTRRVDGQLLAVPCGDDRVRLHRIVVLGRRLVGRFDALRGRGQPRLDIAPLHLGRIADPDAGGNETLDRVEADPGRLGLVTGREQHGPFRRGLEGLGDHDRDRLVRVAHTVVLQNVEPKHEGVRPHVRILRERRPVRRRHDFDDAGVPLRGCHVQKRHPAARDAADRQNGVEHPGRVVVGGKAGASRDLQDAFAASERLAHVRAMPQVCRRLAQRDFRHAGELRKGGRRERPEAPACAREFPPPPASAPASQFRAPVRS